MKGLATFLNWFNRKLTRKFLILLAGFLCVQAIQLGVNMLGTRHLGEEAAVINSAGKQRMRTLLLDSYAHRIAHWEEHRDDRATTVRALIATMADYAAFFQEFERASHEHPWWEEWIEEDRKAPAFQLMAEARKVWAQELEPALVEIALGSNMKRVHDASERIDPLLIAQVDRLDKVMRAIEQDAEGFARDLVLLQAALIGLSLLLGFAGLVMVRQIVSAPLQQLTETTRAIAGGAHDRRVSVRSHDELGDLALNFNQMADALDLRSRRVWALNHVAGTLTSSMGLNEILDQIMHYGVDVIGARAACVVFYDEQDRCFKDPHTQGLSEAFARNMGFPSDALAEQVFSDNHPVVGNDRPGNRHTLSPQERGEGLRAFVCLPLVTMAERLGVIYFYIADRDDFTPDEIAILGSLAHMAANAIENARLYQRVATDARTDALTGLHNRRTFDQRLAEEHSRARRYEKPFALAMIDIDHFKAINDTHGHAAGDAVLRQFARLLARQFRDVDVVARFGGEEFAVILPEISGGTAKGVAERVRRAIADASFALPDGRPLAITASIGVSCFPNCSTDLAGAVSTADQAMYVSKQDGRNRVTLYRETLKARIEKDPNLIAQLLAESLANVLPVVTAISSKAHFLRPHSEQVSAAALSLATVLELSPEECETLRLAALLHDIGMLTIPDAILTRTSPLKPEDWDIIKHHPETGADLLARVPALSKVAELVRHHHERYDGKGYPAGLKGENMPRLTRVLAIADAYGSMVSDWPGHRAISPKQAVSRLKAGAGTQYDPEMVEAMLRALAQDND